MEDVIFAGTSSRAPLGRAEVTVTIDNSDNALPIEYSEVSITRRMFRDGASEYEINGSSCRLMDVQELLSDSGIGREMHVIVGQGKLDEILQSRPEDRRAFIEEAAGVLKHRKRKEKALRKLDAMQANLARLTDLTTELRRQLKPLGRQAEVARRAQTIQADLRDARLRLAADDLVNRQVERDAIFEAEATMRREHDEAAARLAVASEELTAHESALAELSVRAESGPAHLVRAVRAGRAGGRHGAHRQRTRPAPRHRAGVAPATPTPTRWRPRPSRWRSPSSSCSRSSPRARSRLDAARAELAEREREAAEADRAHLAAVRAEADRREGLARLAGQVETMRARVESIDDSVARLSERIEEAAARAQQTRAEFETVQGRVGELDQGEVGLDEHHERTVAALRLADERVAELQAAERGAERQVASLRARIDALSVGLERKDGAAWLTPKPQWRRTFRSDRQVGQGAVGLRGGAGRGARVGGRRAGRRKLRRGPLGGRRPQAGRRRPRGPGVGRLAGRAIRRRIDGLPGGALWALDLVEAPHAAARRDGRHAFRRRGGQRPGRGAGSGGGATATARGHARRRPGGRRMGERRFGPQAVHAGARLRDRQGRQRAGRRGGAGGSADRGAVRRADRADLPSGLRRAGAGRAQRIRHRHLGDVRAAGPARAGGPRRRGRVEPGCCGSARSWKPGARRPSKRSPNSKPGCATPRRPSTVGAGEPSHAEVRQRIAAEAETARGVEVEARLAVRTAEERANAVRGRADSLRRAAAAEREARLRAQQAHAARLRAAAVAAAVADSGRLLAHAVEPGGRGGVAHPRRTGRRTPRAFGRDGGRARRGEHAERPGGGAHRLAAPRRGGQRPGGHAHRAARADGARAVRHGAGRSGRRVRAGGRAAADASWRWPSSSRPASAASR